MAANAQGISLERGRLCVVLATIVINIVAVSLLAFAPWSDWRTGAALNVIDNCLLVGFALVRRDAVLGRFLLFGIIVGVGELPADAWLVDYTRTLDYSSGGGAIRIYRTAIVGTVRQGWFAHDRVAWRDQYSVLRGDGAPDSLVAIQRLPHDFVYAVVHNRWRVRYCIGLRVACANTATRVVARSCRGRNWRWIFHLCLLRACVLDYGSIARVNIHSLSQHERDPKAPGIHAEPETDGAGS
jgi:hypothetical protein